MSAEPSVLVEFDPTVRYYQVERDGKQAVELKAAIKVTVRDAAKARNSKPIIALVGETWGDAADQLRQWFEAGRPTMEDVKAAGPDGLTVGAALNRESRNDG